MANRSHRETVDNEHAFANELRDEIKKYWQQRGFDIVVWVDLPQWPNDGGKKHRAPFFPIRSNIGPYGYPPKKAVAK